MMEEIFRHAAVIENDFVKAWKEKGGKVVGYSCVLTPVEPLDAAGVLGYRLRTLGNSRTDIADAHLSRFNCSFCRSCLQLGLDGTYDFLDGLIETNGCDHLRGMFENWRYVKPGGFFHYVKAPHIVDDDSLAYFEQELRLYIQAVETQFNATISDEALWRAIRRREAVNEKLRALYEMRYVKPSALTGAQVLAIVLLSTAAPLDDFEPLLDRVLAGPQTGAAISVRARLMLLGSATDEVDLVREIESAGGLIAADALCFGARALWSPMPLEGDPVRALAAHYLKNLLCARMVDDFPRRRDFVFSLAERARIDGVVLVHNKFCDVHGVDNVQMRMALEKRGIPALQLEKETGAADLGRMKTRVQAFLEKIGGR